MKLHIPEQTTPDEDDFPNHPRKIKKWLTTLKQANLGDYARQVYNGLILLNKQKMPAKYRMENMEALREPTRYIFNQLHKHFVNRSLPLPAKSQKITHLNQALLEEMAMGYKILVFEAANNIANVEPKTIITACERILHYYSELQLRSSQIYEELPKGAWWDIHHIYHYAEQKNVHKKNIKDTELAAAEVSIEDYYKQILLFSLAHPNALRQSDAERLFKSINEWAKLTFITSQATKNPLNRYFISKLDSDLPPNCVSVTDLQGLQQFRVIETSNLIEHLKTLDIESVDLYSIISTSDTVSTETIRTLTTSWSLCAKRRFSRAERKEKINVSISLNAIYEALNLENNPPKTPSKAKQKITSKTFSLQSTPDHEKTGGSLFEHKKPEFFISHPELKDNGERSAGAWDMVAKGKVLTESYAQEVQNQNNDIDITSAQKSNPDLHWKSTNVSAGGYCLYWDSNIPSRAQVGELISIKEKEPDSTYQYRVGVIRWMQYDCQNGLEIGVQILSHKLISCTVQRVERKTEEPFNCLMLPGIKPVQQPSTLLLPAHAFRSGDVINMHVYERDMKIKLGAVREHTGSFTQFQFSQIDTDNMFKNKNISENNENNVDSEDLNDFNSIWSSL